MAIKFPDIPPSFRPTLPQWAWNWWQDFKSFMVSRLATDGDFTVNTKGKGIVLTNAAGTVTKRVRLNDAGDGFIIEDV